MPTYEGKHLASISKVMYLANFREMGETRGNDFLYIHLPPPWSSSTPLFFSYLTHYIHH